MWNVVLRKKRFLWEPTDDLAQLTDFCGVSTKRTGRQAAPAEPQLSSDSVVLPHDVMIPSICASQVAGSERGEEESRTETAIAPKVSLRSASASGWTGKAMPSCCWGIKIWHRISRGRELEQEGECVIL